MKVLFVESPRLSAQPYRRGLTAPGLVVEAAADDRSALWLVAGGDYGVVVLDLDGASLPWEVVAASLWRRPPARVIALAEPPVGRDLRRKAYGAGVWELIERPSGDPRKVLPGLVSAVRRAGVDGAGPSVLFVDDCTDITDGIGALIADEGYRVETARTADEAIRKIAARDWALVVTETRRIGPDGFRVMQESARLRPALPVVVLTARMDDATLLRAVEMGARACLWKLSEPEEIMREILEALGARQERGQHRT